MKSDAHAATKHKRAKPSNGVPFSETRIIGVCLLIARSLRRVLLLEQRLNRKTLCVAAHETSPLCYSHLAIHEFCQTLVALVDSPVAVKALRS